MTRPVAGSIALYRTLLRVFPRRFRAAQGARMVETFADLAADAWNRRRWLGLAILWTQTIFDLIGNAVAVRRRRSVPAPDHRGPDHRISPRGSASSMDQLAHDLRHGLRSLRGDPGFTAVAIVTLALGIGANAAIFSVFDAVLLRPLPYPQPEELVLVRETDDEGRPMWPSYQNFADWRARSDRFETMAAMTFAGSVTVLGGSEPVRAAGVLVTEGFFDLIGVAPRLGRPLRDDDHRPDAPPVAVISHSLWQRVLGGAEELAGVTLRSAGEVYSIVGVMPQGFRFIRDADIWSPLEPTGRFSVRGAHWLQVVGRLRDPAALERAANQLDQLQARIHEQTGGETDAVGTRVRRLHEVVVGDTRAPLRLLLAAAVLVLLVACSNIASTSLARGSRRSRELAIRRAVGAGRGRLVRQLFTESVVLATAGAAAGLLVAVAVVRGIVATAPTSLPRLDAVGIDGRVLAFTVVAAALSTLIFGLVPALRVSSFGSRIGGGERGGTGDRRTVRMWRGLVVVEVALAVILLLGSGLLIRSMQSIFAADLGFDPSDVVTANLTLPQESYGSEEEMALFFSDLLRQAEAVPGVASVGMVSWLPLDLGAYSAPVELADGTRTEPGLGYRVASAGYFETLRIPLLRGRLFGPQDTPQAPHVAVVNEPFARRLWPEEDPIGRRFRVTGMDAHPEEWLTVVGVVGEARHWLLEPGSQPEYFVSHRQRPFIAGRLRTVLTVRAPDPSADLVAALRSRIRAIDPEVPARFTTVEERMRESVVDRRFTMTLLVGFALVGIVLAAIGIYGVIGYSVATRTREIGIHMALGAAPRVVLTRVLGRAMATVCAGLAIGLVGGWGLQRFIRSLLYEVSPSDAITLIGAPALLMAVSAFASWLPARRAMTIEPTRTMRGD